MRGALEEQATRSATARGGCDLAALQRVGRRHARGGRRPATSPASSSIPSTFHRAIMEAAGNRLLLNIWQSLQIETRTTITMLVEGLDLIEIADSHQPIVDAIASGDAEHAARVAREHQDYFERLPAPGQRPR